jgi:hypothetical protein
MSDATLAEPEAREPKKITVASRPLKRSRTIRLTSSIAVSAMALTMGKV